MDIKRFKEWGYSEDGTESTAQERSSSRRRVKDASVQNGAGSDSRQGRKVKDAPPTRGKVDSEPQFDMRGLPSMLWKPSQPPPSVRKPLSPAAKWRIKVLVVGVLIAVGIFMGKAINSGNASSSSSPSDSVVTPPTDPFSTSCIYLEDNLDGTGKDYKRYATVLESLDPMVGTPAFTSRISGLWNIVNDAESGMYPWGYRNQLIYLSIRGQIAQECSS